MKKLFTLLTLLVAIVTGAWAAVTDLSFSATKTVTAGGEIWWTTSTNVATANTAGWCTKNGNGSNNKSGNITPSLSGDDTDTNPANHTVDGVLVKGGNTPSDLTTSKKALVFKVTNTTAITAYGATTSGSEAAGLQWSIYKVRDNSAVATNAKGKAAAVNTTCTISISGLSASETYIVSIEGGYKGTAGSDVGTSNQDVVVYAVKFAAPQAGKPTINTQPVSANYEVSDEATALSVAATASSGDLSYQWYSNTSATTEGATALIGETGGSYTPSTASAGSTYYYCAVTDGNGTTNSNFATITVVNVFTPEISFADPAVTITYTGSGKVYYTIDGTEPSSTNGTEYSAPFNLTNSCTVRAVAKVGENYSDEVKYNCYVDQSSADGFLISTGYHSGTNSGSVWTSTDGNFKLSKPEGEFNWSNHLFPGMHGHKMDNGIVYTLQPNEDIKITSIKIVGRTWLDGTAATVAVSGGTPESATWLAGETGNVSYILTKEFAVDANYGEAVTISPTGNQFGCFLEVYGVKRSGPADPQAVAGTTVTWDFTSSSVGTVTASTSNTLLSTSGTSMNITYIAGSGCSRDNTDGLKAGGKTSVSSSNWTDRYFVLQIAKSGTLSITSGSNYGEYKIYKGASSTFSSATSVTTITTTSGGTASANISYDSSNPYIFIGFTDAKRYTKKISWTPATDDITLTTSDNMAGWRAFYDADKSYTVDGNTKIYIVTAKDETKATLTEVTGRIPAKTPVLLKTSDANHTMTLTATDTGDEINTNGNQLQVTDGNAVNGVYRLGYGAGGIGFYQYSATSPASGIVYLSSTGGAKALTFVFSDPTGISSVSAKKAVSTGKRFNLSGQLVGEDYKGIVIENGKKYIK